MLKATWNHAIIAESDQTVTIEGNDYFPADSINREYLLENPQTTVCGWKGTANYYDIVVDGEKNEAAVWYYADPKPEAVKIKGFVAFWKGVTVTQSAGGK